MGVYTFTPVVPCFPGLEACERKFRDELGLRCVSSEVRERVRRKGGGSPADTTTDD